MGIPNDQREFSRKTFWKSNIFRKSGSVLSGRTVGYINRGILVRLSDIGFQNEKTVILRE